MAKTNLVDAISFGDYRLEIRHKSPGLRELELFLGEGRQRRVSIQKQTLTILKRMLVDPDGNLIPKNTLVRKEDLLMAAWGDSGVDNLDTQMGALRKALKEETPNQCFIENIRGEGFIRTVEAWREARSAHATDPTSHDTEGKFRELFGMTADNQSGIIFLQSDVIDELLPSRARQAVAKPSSRLYKARTWVNFWDTYAAKVLQEKFQTMQMDPPTLVLSSHQIQPTSHVPPAFKISLGLGFTDATLQAIRDEIFLPWMGIRIGRPYGDSVSLHRKLVAKPSTNKPRYRVRRDGTSKSVFRQIVPSDWNRDYAKLWFEMLAPRRKGRDVSDYAIILRHTRLRPARQVVFVVAGFTERGTAVGGQFLADNWKDLWETHVMGRAHGGSLGDFLIFIEGPSDPRRIGEWSEITELRVTPEKLASKAINIPCEWQNRIIAIPTSAPGN